METLNKWYSDVIDNETIEKGPSITYITLFLDNFDPSLCHTLSHIPGPPKVRYTSRTLPRFLVGLVQSTRTKAPCTNSLIVVRGGFCPGGFSGVFWLEGFVRGGFCPFPFCQNTSATTES